MEEKKLIRKQIFKLRKECTDSQVEAWSRQIAQKVAELPEFQSAQKILAYADYNHEVMTGFIIEEAWKQGKEVAVPKVVGQDMVFYKLTDFSQLEKGYFGIPEPARGEIVQWEDAMMGGSTGARWKEPRPARLANRWSRRTSRRTDGAARDSRSPRPQPSGTCRRTAETAETCAD